MASFDVLMLFDIWVYNINKVFRTATADVSANRLLICADIRYKERGFWDNNVYANIFVREMYLNICVRWIFLDNLIDI